MRILEIDEVSSGYGDVQVLWGASLFLEEGMITALVGANGSGKTTLLRTIMGLVKPKSGSIRLNGQDITRLSAHEKASMGLVLVPEGSQLFVNMSVEENLQMGASPRRAKPRAKQNQERVYTIFPRLHERRHQKARTLSGGEQQMLAVARGLMSDPLVLMIDELSLGLAPLLALDLFRTLQNLKDEGLTLLLVEQNVHMALAVTDHGFVLENGQTDTHGPSQMLVNDPKIRAAYLGI